MTEASCRKWWQRWWLQSQEKDQASYMEVTMIATIETRPNLDLALNLSVITLTEARYGIWRRALRLKVPKHWSQSVQANIGLADFDKAGMAISHLCVSLRIHKSAIAVRLINRFKNNRNTKRPRLLKIYHQNIARACRSYWQSISRQRNTANNSIDTKHRLEGIKLYINGWRKTDSLTANLYKTSSNMIYSLCNDFCDYAPRR